MPSYVQEIFNDPPVFLNSSKSEREKLKVVKSIFKQLQRWFYLFSYIVFPTAHSLAALSSLSKISLSSPFLAWISGQSTAKVFCYSQCFFLSYSQASTLPNAPILSLLASSLWLSRRTLEGFSSPILEFLPQHMNNETPGHIQVGCNYSWARPSHDRSSVTEERVLKNRVLSSCSSPQRTPVMQQR